MCDGKTKFLFGCVFPRGQNEKSVIRWTGVVVTMTPLVTTEGAVPSVTRYPVSTRRAYKGVYTPTGAMVLGRRWQRGQLTLVESSPSFYICAYSVRVHYTTLGRQRLIPPHPTTRPVSPYTPFAISSGRRTHHHYRRVSRGDAHPPFWTKKLIL